MCLSSCSCQIFVMPVMYYIVCDSVQFGLKANLVGGLGPLESFYAFVVSLCVQESRAWNPESTLQHPESSLLMESTV